MGVALFALLVAGAVPTLLHAPGATAAGPAPPFGPTPSHQTVGPAPTGAGRISPAAGPLAVQFTASLVNGTVVAGNEVLPGYFHPVESAFDPVHDLWFVEDADRSVVALDASTLQTVAELPTPNGSGPMVVDPVHGRLYVGSFRVIYEFNTSTLRSAGVVPVGTGPWQVSALVDDPDHQRLLAAASPNASGLLVDTSTGTVVGSVAGIPDLSVGVYDPLLGDLLLGNSSSSDVEELDAVRDQVVGTLNVGGGTVSGLAIDPTGVDLFSSGPGLGLSRTDVVNGTVMARHDFGTRPSGLVFDPDTGVAIVADPAASLLSAFYATNASPAWSVAVPNDLPISSNTWQPVESPALGTVFLASGFADSLEAVSVLNHTVYRSLPTWTEPEAIAWDGACGCYAIPDLTRDVVELVDPATLRVKTTAPLPAGGTSIAYAGDTGDLFVTLFQGPLSEGIAVLNGSTGALVRTLTGVSSPAGIAYDPANGDMYVTDGGAKRVAVFNATTYAWVRNITLGGWGWGMAYVPGPNEIFAADGTDVAIIDAATQSVNATVPLGGTVNQLAYDPVNGAVYAAAEYGAASGNVTPIDVTTAQTGTPIPVLFPQSLAVDPSTGTVFIANLTGNLTAVNISTSTISHLPVGEQGDSLLWAPNGQLIEGDTLGGAIYDISSAPDVHLYNATFSVTPFLVTTGTTVTVTTDASGGVGTVTVQYSGLPAGCPGSGAAFQCAPTSPGTYPIMATLTDSSGDRVVQEAVLWVSAAYPVWLNESGLPSGTTWNVTVTGEATALSSSTPSISTLLGNGTYVFVATSTDAAGGTSIGGFSVVGGATDVAVDFSGAGYTISFLEGGLPTGTPWRIWLSTGDVASGSSPELQLREPNGDYTYSPSSGNTSWGAAGGSVSVAGASVNVGLSFQLVTYPVTFTESGLAAGSLWNISVGSAHASGSGSELILTLPNGTHPFVALTSVPGFAPVTGTVTVDGASTGAAVAFGQPAYLVTVRESGLPAGTPWWFNLTGILSQASSTAQIELNLSDGSYPYTIGGPVTYTPTPAGGTLTVSGGPGGLTVAFQPVGSHGPAALTLAAYSAVPGSFVLGGSTNISVQAAGGVPPYSYAFRDLPVGCSTLNRSWDLCTPSQVGSWTVEIVVTDPTGAAAFANVTIVTVAPAPGGSSTGSFDTWIYLGAAVVGAAVVAVVVVRWRQTRRPPPVEAPDDAPGEASELPPAEDGGFEPVTPP